MHILAWAALVAGLMGPGVGAQEVEPESLAPLTEAEVLLVLTPDHPAVRLAQSAVDAAEARALTARLLNSPEIGVVREDVSGPTRQVDLSVRWRPFERGRRKRMGAAQEQVSAAQEARASDLLTARLELREAFAAWSLASSRAGAFAAEVEQLDALARRESARFERGEASGLEARRLTLARAQMEKKLALVRADALEARAAVESWWPDLADLERAPTVPEPPDPREVERLVASNGSGEHPELARVTAEARAKALTADAERHVVDLPEFLAGWQSQRTTTASLDGPVLGLFWRVPLRDRHRSDRLLAEAELDAAEARTVLLRQEQTAQLDRALQTYAELFRALERARAAVQGNERLVEAALASFRLGESSLTELLDLLSATDNSEIAVLDLLEGALAAHRTLESIVGRPLVSEGPTPDG